MALIRRGKVLIIPHGDDKLLHSDTIYFVTRPSDIGYVAEATGQCNMRVKNVMIIGGGKITSMICAMGAGAYNITVIEPDRNMAGRIAEQFPDVTVVNASSRQLSVLKEEEIGKMDIFMALSQSDESNIVGCMVAKESGVKKDCGTS